MRFEEISSQDDFETFFFEERNFDYKDDETIQIDKRHRVKYYFIDNLNYSRAYRLYKEYKGFPMTPYYIFIDSSFNAYYIFSEYHTPFKFVYKKSSRERDYTKKSRLQLLNALKYVDKEYNDSFQALFDTKPLVKKFYDEYRVIKTRLFESLRGLPEEEKWFYSQVILDRIIFIYFLQSREIIKKDYLLDLFRNKDTKKNFLKNYLEPLFFNAFNTKHKFYENVVGDGVDFGHIPYLNGGLFSRKDVEKENEIAINDNIWEEIFKLFDSYEWVVEERHEEAVVLTPSILGHIFEQSITGRKGKGAYYTPSEITEYISKNTIYPYIMDRLNERFGTNYRNITYGLLDKKNLTEKEINIITELYFNILKELKVLDNACGSGAFLMAAHRILLALYKKCYHVLKDEMVFSAENKAIDRYGSYDYYFKRLIATHNIYGVDLEEGAVEIAKLRLWLSMISNLSIESVEPLPNIDYNIMRGNSLIGFVEAPFKEQTAIDSPETTMQILKAKGILINSYKATTDPIKAEELKKDIENINEKFRSELDEKFHRMLTVDYKINISKEELEALHPFHWGFEFYEAFDLDKPKEERGFDVVIGNPPYVRQETIKELKLLFKVLYSNVYNGVADLAVYFIKRSVDNLKEGGYHSYIITNKWIRSRYGTQMRDFLQNSIKINEIIDFNGVRVFIGPSVDTTVYILIKSDDSSGNIKYCDYKEAQVISLADYIKRNSFNVSQPNLKREGWSFYSKEMSEIVNYINSVGNPLKDMDIRINYGIKTGYNKAFIINEKTKNMLIQKDTKNAEIIKPLIRGRNIKRFHVEFRGEYLIFTKHGINIDEYPAVKSYLEQYREKLEPRLPNWSGEKKWEGRKPGPYKWYEIQDTVDYYRGFEKPKMIYPVIGNNTFFYDTAGFYTNDKCFILPTDKKYLTLFFSSNLLHTYFTTIGAKLGSKGYEYRKIFMENLQIIFPENETPFFILTDFLHFCSRMKYMSKENFSEQRYLFFKLISDSLVYTLYFKEKFAGDGVPTNLAELVESYLVNIDGLGLDEEKIAAIEKVYEKITADEEIMETIEKIKSHEWVKVVERYG